MFNLIIKSPNHTITDFPLTCPPTWTIADLKAHLASNYPGSPPISSQRLIYSGKLLTDSQTLATALQHAPCTGTEAGSTFAMHLVISPNRDRLATSASLSRIVGEVVDVSNNNTMASSQASTSSASTLPSSNVATNSFPAFSAEEAHRYQQEYESYLRNYYYQCLWQGVVAQPLYPGAVAWSNFTSGGAELNQLRNRMTLPTNVEEPPAAAAEGGVPQAAVMPQEARPGAGANNVAPAAFGGFLDAAADGGGEGGENRDPMDVLYVLLRLVLLGALTYYYSTPEKAVLFLVLLALIYILQGNLCRAFLANLWPDARNALGLDNEQPPPPAQDTATPPVVNEGQSPQAAAQPENASFFDRFLWLRAVFIVIVSSMRIFVTFFTSLIPERPPPIDIN